MKKCTTIFWNGTIPPANPTSKQKPWEKAENTLVMSDKEQTSVLTKGTQQDLVDKRFGKLTVLEYDQEKKKWKCQCDCGKTVFVRTTSLTSGHTTSCGCVKQELDEEKDFREILTYMDNTCIEFAKGISKPRSTTSPDTGVRGVILKDGKYQA